MAREEKEGPPPEIFKKNRDLAPEEINERTVYDVGEGEDYDEDALRKYQLERLRYVSVPRPGIFLIPYFVGTTTLLLNAIVLRQRRTFLMNWMARSSSDRPTCSTSVSSRTI